ncbi:hypothetical protein HF086_010305 [Spodoptera exigua]|uniref:Ubiquitin-like domain-containing protein n=1 Tax=Spodoptera exigua TaxID=7107 RepID=A0A922M1I3_SPOEX|nr:hypothetical protein HF086_010305 [Spodoptera exigua]
MKKLDVHKLLGISPNPQSETGATACQCDLGREKLLTAPPYKTTPSGDETKSRYPTAPTTREADQLTCPISHILVTFKSPLNPNDVFSKVFPASTPVKFVKRKLAKLLGVSNSNLILTKNRNVLKETSILSQLKADPLGNLSVDVFTKDSEDFSLSSIPKESYVHELLHAVLPKKKDMPFIAIKFRVPNQNATFTRSYHSIMKVHEIKKNLGELFQVDPAVLVFLRGDNPLKDRMALMDLDYDKYGIAEIEVLTTNNATLNLEKLYKEIPVNDVLSVTVPFGSTIKQINVEIFSEPMTKPYLGGYKNVHTGTIYHHAYTQTPQKPEKLRPEEKNCRDTQTAEEKEKLYPKNLLERIERMKEEDRLEKEAMERRLRRDLITKTFPKTREDFDQLYAMVS